MKTDYAARIKQVREILCASKLDALLVLIAENRRYLSGFSGEDTQFDESAGVLIISAEKLILATDSRFELQARQEAADYEVSLYREGLAKELPLLLKGLTMGRLGFESIRMSCAQQAKMASALKDAGLRIELVPTEDVVEALRIAKASSEIAAIRSALRLAESVFRSVAGGLRPGMTEKEAAWSLEKALREAGADALSFPVIAASGPNSAMPHAIPGERRLRPNEPILFDWGVRLDGYCSDISRTLFMGQRDETFLKVFQTVREAQEMAIAAIKPGVDCRAIDAIARNHIEQKGFKGRFGHGLGHGVGLAIHEQPRLSPLHDKMLAPGMVLTVEPGIYLPGWGGVRLENMIAVTDEGAEVLNQTDVDSVRVEA